MEVGAGCDALGIDPDSFDVLVTDVVMPGGVNGHQLADHMRARRADLPVLYMSGYDPEAIADRGVDSDAPLLPKPFTRAALLDALGRVMDGEATVSRVA